MAGTMKAVRIHEYGGPDVLRFEDAPVPEPAPGEVLLRARGAGVNPVDWKTRSGGGQADKIGERFPLVLGWDTSGVVEAVGEGSAAYAPGDELFGLVNFPQPGQAYAEFVAAPADQLAARPVSLNHVEAAALPMVALTAWQALIEAAGLDRGHTVLIHAAAGGVGHVAVQLARWKRARVVGTASARNAGFLESLGVEQVVDYTASPFEEAVSGVDVVLDSIGGDVFERSLDVLRPGGTIVSLRERGAEEKAAAREMRGIYVLVRPEGNQLAQVGALVDAGHVRPAVEVELVLAEAGKAHQMSEEGHTRGKIVLRPD